VASIFGHGLSMLKEMLAAGYFGVSKAMDSYYAALTIPDSINSIIFSPFTLIFIPIFIKYKLEDKEAANRLVSTIANFILIVLLGASVLVFTFAAQLIKYASPGLDAETALTAVKMLRIISFSMFFGGAVNVLTGILNALENFLWPAVSGTFITLSTIFFILGFADKWGISVVGWGLLVGTVLQAMFLIPFAGKYGFKHYNTLDLGHPEIKKALNLVLILLIMSVLSSLNSVINRFLASWLPVGSIAALAYAGKLVQIPSIIFSSSIAAAIYPFLAAQAAENKIEDIKHTVSMSIRMSGFIFIPLAVMLMVLARPAIQFLFQRGAFDAAATDLTSKIFMLLSLQLFSGYALVILMRLLFAFQDLMVMLKIMVVNVILNLAMSFVLIKLFNPPACGIALSTSLGSFVTAILYFLVLKKRISNLHGVAIFKSLSRITAFSLVSGLTAFLVYRGMSGASHGTLPEQLMALAAAFCAGSLVFILISSAFKLEEFQKVYLLVKTKFSRART